MAVVHIVTLYSTATAVSCSLSLEIAVDLWSFSELLGALDVLE